MNLSKNDLKYYSSLQQKKFRREEKKFIVEGNKAISDAISSRFKPELIICTEKFYENNTFIISEYLGKKIPICKITEKEFEKICDTQTPQGILAVFNFFNYSINDLSGKIIIALENISDPGNLGTIIRNCDWFGFNNIILSNECADIYNPKVIRSTMGSIFHISFVTSQNFISDLNFLRDDGYKILTADLDGKNLNNFSNPGKCVIVLCNEASGPGENLLSVSDEIITIPKYGLAESLNVANASAVILAHFAKNLHMF